MRRRTLLAGLGATVVALPRAARSQSKSLPKIGIVGSLGPLAVHALKDGLRDAGLTEGQNITILGGPASGAGPEVVTKLIADYIAKQVDVIFASGTLATQTAKAATSSIPIVSLSGSPVTAGLVESLAHPGGNVTGLSILAPESNGKRLELLYQLIPDLQRVAAIYNPDDNDVEQSQKSTEIAAAKLHFNLQRLSARVESEFAGVFAAAVTDKVQAVLLTPNPVLDIGGRQIAELELRNKLPVMSFNETFPKAGGLISYGADVLLVYKRGGYYVSRILAGTPPGELPVEQPTKFNLVINLQRAKALDLKVPDTLLASADEVIE